MVGVLIRMKLRVLAHSIHGTRGASFVIGAIAGIVVGIVCLVLIAAHPGDLSVGADIAAALFAAWTLGWLFGPILAGGGDETLRPENFALLPIRPAQLAFGLLGASLAGVAPVATAIVMLGLVIAAVAGGVGAVLVALVVVVLQLALAVLLSRVVIAGLGALLGSRRGKDLGVLLAAVVGAAYIPARLAVEELAPIVVGQTSPLFTGVLRALPTGWGPDAVVAAATSDWGRALGLLLALAVLDALLVLAWSRLLVRRMTTPMTATSPRAAATTARTQRRGLTATSPLGAVIVKELRCWWRDAQRRALMFGGIVVGLIIPFVSGSGFALAPLWISFFAAMQINNLYGMDGSAVWQTLVTPGAARADVRGRQWAWTLIVGPVVLVAAAVLPAVAGSPGTYPWVLAVAPALLGGAAGTILLVSVRSPFAMPAARGRNPFAAGGRPGFDNFLSRMGTLLQQLAVAIPAVVLLSAGALTGSSVLTWAAIPVGVASGIAAAWIFGRQAYMRLDARGPELLAVVRSVV